MAIPGGVAFDVTVMGDVYLDHVFSGFGAWPLPGEEVFTEQYTFELGGGAIVTACALARLGRRVQLIGVVGECEAATVARRLEDFGVSAELLVRRPGRSGVTVSVSTETDRSFFTYRGVNAELQPLLARDAELVRRAASARFVHMAMPLDLETGPGLVAALRGNGAQVTLDVGHQVEWLRSAGGREILRMVDYFLPNEKEAELLAGDADGYLRLCAALGVKRAVVKLGAAGAVMLADGAEVRTGAPSGRVLDTTGAGDAFNAGLIDELLAGGSALSCLQHACACGTISTGAAGGLGALPTRAEARELWEKSYAT